jgi:hypothetical protein
VVQALLGNRTPPRLRRLGIAQLWAGSRIGERPAHNKWTGPEQWLQIFSAIAEIESPRLIEPALAVGSCVVHGRRPS